jgi:hypothetical protein
MNPDEARAALIAAGFAEPSAGEVTMLNVLGGGEQVDL